MPTCRTLDYLEPGLPVIPVAATFARTYSAQLFASCSSPTWAVTPALSAGLSLAADTGAITGTPTAASAANHTFKAVRSGYQTGSQTISFVVW